MVRTINNVYIGDERTIGRFILTRVDHAHYHIYSIDSDKAYAFTPKRPGRGKERRTTGDKVRQVQDAVLTYVQTGTLPKRSASIRETPVKTGERYKAIYESE